MPGDAKRRVLGMVTGVRLRNDCLKDRDFDITSFGILARCVYGDDTTIRDVFDLKRPDD